MQIYWSKGLYYNSRLFKNEWTLNTFIKNIEGFGNHTKNIFIKKFELSHHRFYPDIIFHRNVTNRNKILNNYLSYILTPLSNRSELHRYSLIRLYLIKSFRGRAQALGKPSRGQRTWSNAWTAFKNNTLLGNFINEVLKHKKKTTTLKKKNYKVLTKKIKKKVFKIKPIVKKNIVNMWF